MTDGHEKDLKGNRESVAVTTRHNLNKLAAKKDKETAPKNRLCLNLCCTSPVKRQLVGRTDLKFL
mgnify:CR=1 FL=1